MKERTLFIISGHIWAACSVGWWMISNGLDLPAAGFIAFCCGIVAVGFWARAL